ncbi:extracellular solute-binding protein [Devosia algicola]|uniref:Extracellular solute-binding protein n=1 Tax=Devosia algicola TaxID=3026418 RepID=A0ABY7YMR1_9HYPH|nr:extracellular solute-binding protein [Devosia algicola]WDR02568.1 extracellular solute-binding protein [Devosia algicola]
MHRSIKSIASGMALAGFCCASLLSAGAAMAQDQVTLKMWSLVNDNYPEFIDLAEKEFQKTHPNVNIELESTPNEAYKTAIQVALVGSEPPDVFFNWAGEDSARLARDGLALDITDLGDMDGGFKSLISESLAADLCRQWQALWRSH